MNWLAKLAAKEKTALEHLDEALENYSRTHLQDLINDLEPTYRGVLETKTKIARHAQMGVELAHEMNKEAMLPAIMAGARALAGPVMKTIAKDAVVGGVANKLTGALKPAGGQAAGAAGLGGGFKYAGIAGAAGGGLAGLGRQAAGFFHRNPGAAVTLGGAAAGAVMAPRDPQTGEKQMLRGAVMGGGLAAGANALSKGQIADKMKHMVTRQNNPVLGQGARRYMTESAMMTRPGAGVAAGTSPAQWQQAHAGVQEMKDKAMLAQTGPKGPAPVPVQQYMGGPTQGAVKVASLIDYVRHQAMEKKANKGLLTYDPATKTFNKQTVTNTPPVR